MRYFDEAARTWDDPQKVARAERVADAIAAAVPGLARRHVLEYGSGTGLLGLALRDRVASVTLADSSREMSAVAREKVAALGAANVAVVERDLTEGPLPEERYDLVCTLMVLHHIPDTEAILRRFHALLREGGGVCVADLDAEDGSFHAAVPLGGDHHGREHHVHQGFRREELAARLAAAGFRDVRFETAGEIEKVTASGPRRFPVFLATAWR